jgi:uncharacterized RDD family membrane protein YckC
MHSGETAAAQAAASKHTLQSIGRNAAKFLSIAAVFGGIIAILFHPERKGWHDSLSGTEVINANYPIRR